MSLSSLRDRAVQLLNGGYFAHEVSSILAVEYSYLDEFQREDLTKLVLIWEGKNNAINFK